LRLLTGVSFGLAAHSICILTCGAYKISAARKKAMPVVFGQTIEILQLGGGPSDEETNFIWNVEQRVGPGSSGDDVRLVQYLLAMWGADYSIPGVIVLDDVSGSWDSKTSASMALFEKNLTSAALADGVVDPMPPDTVGFSAARSSYLYKIYSLQWAYSQKRGRHDLLEVESEVVMDIPNDVTCPTDLSYALIAAQTKAGFDP
jgi:hypothetical protein